MKTYGTVIDSLLERLSPLIRERVVLGRIHLVNGTFLSFEAETILLVHRCFQAWASEHGFEDPSTLRDDLHRHIKASGNHRWTMALERLFKYLPDEFNVRGKWTPEELACDSRCDQKRARQRS
jgi:hypothetical protein